MKPISSARGFLSNLGVKLIALVVALIIWFNAAGQEEVNRTVVAPLSFVNIPDSLTVTGRVPTQVELGVSATRRELLLLGMSSCARFRIEMLVNLARAQPGQFTQRLSVSDLLLPPGMEPGDVRILSPVALAVNLERVVSRRLRVSVVTREELPAGLVFTRPPEARPGWARVTGPESVVQAMDRINTSPVDLSKVRESADRETSLDFDTRELAVVPERVIVSMSLGERAQRVLGNLPPTVLNDRPGFMTVVTPNTLTVTLHGPKALLDTLSSKDVSILVDVSGKPPGRYVVTPDVIVPEGVVGFSVDADTLQVRVEPRPPDPQRGQ